MMLWQIRITKILNYSKEVILSNSNNYMSLTSVTCSLGFPCVFSVLQNILSGMESNCNSFIKLLLRDKHT